VGLVAPTSAEYRLLGTDEAFLGSLRAATGGTVITTALQPWTHDLRVTSHFTDLWPLLLLLALLLWPLDIALRRVSVGRREFALARGWVRGIGGRRRTTAPRTTTGASLLAARERATGAPSRASLRGSTTATVEPPSAGSTPAATTATPPPPQQAATAPKSDPKPTPPPAAPPPPPSAPTAPTEATDTLTKLRDAKRARGR
jgi:outer membrane biosynthesis protein TonB